MALCKTDAIVLKAHNFGESSKIVAMYTKKYGKCKVVAKGARRPKSALCGNLEPATHVSVVFYKKDDRELHTLSQSDMITPFLELQVDVERFAYANAMCELLDRLTPMEVESRAIFTLTLESFEIIQKTHGEDLNVLLWFFEIRLLTFLGFKPELYTCVHCKRDVTGNPVGFSPPKGGVLCATCAPKDEEAYVLSLDSLAFLRHLQRTRTKNATKLKIPQKAAAEIDNLLQAFLKYHVYDFQDIKSLRVLGRLHSRLSSTTL